MKIAYGLPAVAALCAAAVMSACSGAAGDGGAADPLLWLEPPHAEQALEWARTETARSTDELSALPVYGQVEQELATILAGARPEPDLYRIGDRWMRLQRDAARPFGVLQVAEADADGRPGAWEDRLDVGALREAEGIAFELQAYTMDGMCLAPEFARCLLRLSPGGGDEVEIREFDLERGAFVEDGFHIPRSRAFANWLGPDRVLFETTAGERPVTMAGWPASVQVWERGQSLDDAVEVFQADPDDAIVQIETMGQGADRRGVVTRAITYTRFEVVVVQPDLTTHVADLPEALKPMGPQAATGQHLVVQLAEPAVLGGTHYPAEAVVAYDVRAGLDDSARHSLVLLPEKGEFVGGSSDIAAAGDEVLVSVTRSLVPRVLAVAYDPAEGRWDAREVFQAEPGTTVTLRSSDDSAMIVNGGFVLPSRQQLYRDGSIALIAEDPVLVDGAGYVTEIGTAVSADGTEVDYYLLRTRDAQPGVPQPVLMTGYGAFGMSASPGHFDYLVGGPSFALWLNRGGWLVVPAARGGGERGAAWHRAAMREQRQNSYDDFIAVAGKLVADRVTEPSMMGVFGMSNGGLLSATLGTQRPDLFGAVVSDVPLADMLRMKHMGMGAAWLNEYGDPDEPGMEEVLRAYSPYHNVREGQAYPPFLVTISTEDNRVGPGHARKLAARLMEAGVETYFLEDEEGGHGVSDPLRNPELMALRMSFLIDKLMPAH